MRTARVTKLICESGKFVALTTIKSEPIIEQEIKESPPKVKKIYCLKIIKIYHNQILQCDIQEKKVQLQMQLNTQHLAQLRHF